MWYIILIIALVLFASALLWPSEPTCFGYYYRAGVSCNQCEWRKACLSETRSTCIDNMNPDHLDCQACWRVDCKEAEHDGPA